MRKIGTLLFVLILLGTWLTANSQILTPVKWKYSVKQVSETEADLVVNATIEEGWHLYGQYFPDGGPIRLEFAFVQTGNYKKIGKVKESPAPHKEMDDIFGIEVQSFKKNATFTQRIKISSEKDFKITGELNGQACLDDGKCVALTEELNFSIKGVAGTKPNIEEIKKTENSKTDTTSQIIDTLNKKTTVEYKKIEHSKTTPIIVKSNPWKDKEDGKNNSIIWFFLISLGFGLTALVTPCVFPMIPMTVSFFMHSEKSKKRSRINAILYGISIVAIYTLPIAIIIGIANIGGHDSVSGDFANFLSTHWLPNIFFFLIFVIFAASFFGMFEIVLPNWLVSKSDKQADKGGLIGIFFMAFTLVLVSFSCTGPIVGGILVQSTQGGDVIKPVIGMLGFSIGVALPFTLFAFFPQVLKKLPKSGGWLNSVKVILGFIELALGMKFLSVADQTYHWGLLDRDIYIAVWIVIFFLMGIYLLGKLKFAHDSEVSFLKVPRLIFAIITFSFVVYLIPGMWGAPLKGLSGYLPPLATHDFDLTKKIGGSSESNLCEEPKYKDELHLPHGLTGYFDYYQAAECSQQQNKPIFIDFTGHGCVNCREMEANVWSDPRVLQILREDYIILAMYVDDKKIEIPEKEWFTSSFDKKVKSSLGKQNADIQIVNFNKNSQPYYVLLNTEGDILAEPRAYDLDVTAFVKFLEEGKKNFKLKSKI